MRCGATSSHTALASRRSVSCVRTARPTGDVTRRAGSGNRDLGDLIAAEPGDRPLSPRRHGGAPGAPPHRSGAGPAGQQPRARPGPAGADQRLPVAGVVPGARPALRLPRRLRRRSSLASKHWRVLGSARPHDEPGEGPSPRGPATPGGDGPAAGRSHGGGGGVSVRAAVPHAAETVDVASDHLTIGVTAVTSQRVVRQRSTPRSPPAG